MFKAGDYIVYSGQGVCQVLEVTNPPDKKMSDKGLYYVLSPVCGECRIYIPVNTSVFMRPILSKKAAKDLLKNISVMQPLNCNNRVVSALAMEYKGHLKANDCETMLRLLKGLYQRKKQGRKLGQVDIDFCKRIEQMVFNEFAVVLDISVDEAAACIKKACLETVAR